MAKLKSSDKPTATPLARTAQLAKKLLAVPKREADKQHQKYERDKRKS